MNTKIVHVQSLFPLEVIDALKEKTGEFYVKEAISKAVYHYLNCQDPDRDNRKTKTISNFRGSRIKTREIGSRKNELGFEELSAFETIPDRDSLMKERALKDNVTFKQDTDSQLEIQADKERFKQIIPSLLSKGRDITYEIAKSDFDSKR